MLLSLGQMGFVRYKIELSKHFRHEIEDNKLLVSCKEALKLWTFLIDHESLEYGNWKLNRSVIYLTPDSFHSVGTSHRSRRIERNLSSSPSCQREIKA